MANIIDKTRPEQQELKPVEYGGMGRPEDSRLKGYNGKVTHPTLPLERTYCSRCGEGYGWVTEESSEYIAAAEIIVYCNKCEEWMRNNLGPIPLQVAAPGDAIEIPSLRRGSLPSRLGE